MTTGNSFAVLASMSAQPPSPSPSPVLTSAAGRGRRVGRAARGTRGGARGSGRSAAAANNANFAGNGNAAVSNSNHNFVPSRIGGNGAANGNKRPHRALPPYKAAAASVIVSEPAAARAACLALGAHSRIAVDCEGVTLSRTGRLCLVQIASPQSVFLFDIIKGGKALFESGLRELLESPKTIKVMHDCRHDCDALLHQFETRLAPIMDTQVAFSVLRRVRNLKVGLPVSLKTLLKKFVGVSEDDISVKEDIKKTMQSNAEFWLQRPLPPDALQYARFDVVYLLHVAKLLAIYISDAETTAWDRVLRESSAYSALFRDDADGPRKAGIEWARMLTECKAEQAEKERKSQAAALKEVDPVRTFKFDRDIVLLPLKGINICDSRSNGSA
jgi:hypothetical protein